MRDFRKVHRFHVSLEAAISALFRDDAVSHEYHAALGHTGTSAFPSLGVYFRMICKTLMNHRITGVVVSDWIEQPGGYWERVCFYTTTEEGDGDGNQ